MSTNKELEIYKSNFDLIKKIQIVVYYIDENRLAWIKKQFYHLNLGIDIFYFKGYTKEESIDYINDIHPNHPESESDGHLSAMRTLSSVFNWFLKYCKDKEFLITVEDDCCLLKEEILDSILKAVNTYKEYYEKFDYVCLGYLPFDINKIKIRNLPTNSSIYWDMWKNRKSNDDFDEIYGGQMMLFNKDIVMQLSEIFHQKNTSTIRKMINERLLQSYRYSHKVDILLGDHVFPLLFRQSVFYPPLAVEGDFITENGNQNWTLRPWNKYLDITDYWINTKQNQQIIL